MIGIKSGIIGKRRSLRVKDSIELEIEGVNGADPTKDLRLVNPAFSAVPGSDLIVARSSKYHYKDYGLEWNNSGKNVTRGNAVTIEIAITRHSNSLIIIAIIVESVLAQEGYGDQSLLPQVLDSSSGYQITALT